MAVESPRLTPCERAILRSTFARFADRIDRVAIFGSRALGRSAPASDIDLVVYGEIDDAAVARIWTLLNESSLAVTADIVRYGALGDAPLRRHIDQCAKPLFEREELRDAASHAA
jgi:predicted nucleotidyltransferase